MQRKASKGSKGDATMKEEGGERGLKAGKKSGRGESIEG